MFVAIPVLNYSAFYPNSEIPAQPLDLITEFNLEDVILTMIALRNSLDRNRHDVSNDKMVSELMKMLPASKSKRLKSFIFGDKGFTLIHSVVISKILVDLFSTLLSTNRPNPNLVEGQYEERILDLILIYNERHYSNENIEKADHSQEFVWSLMMMQKLSGVEEIDYARTGAIKHLILLSYLRTALGTDFPQLEQSLKDGAGIENIRQFLGVFFEIFVFLTKEDAPDLLLPQISEKDPNYTYLKLMGLIIDREVLAEEKFDVGTLLMRPFFRASNGITYLLDHRDFSLIVERGFMFLLFNKSNIRELFAIKDFNGMLGHFGLHYYERFLLNTLLKSMERAGLRVIASDDRNLADFTLVINETDVFLIEIKSVSINYRVFEQQNVVGFKKYLDDQFSGKKGVKQLVKNIAYLTNDTLKLLSLKKPSSKLNVFPIIIFVDPRVGTYGVNDYVSEIAEEHFGLLRANFKTLKPLTMISSDFFLENIELLQSDRSLLKRLIINYHATIQNRKQSYKKFNSTANYVNRMASFDHVCIGKERVYRLDQTRIFKNLVSIFRLKETL